MLLYILKHVSWVTVTQSSGGRGRWISEFKASLVYRVSSRTARTTQRNPISKNKTKQNKNKNPSVYLFICLFLLCVCISHMYVSICQNPGAATWVLGPELRSPGGALSVLNHWALSSLFVCFLENRSFLYSTGWPWVMFLVPQPLKCRNYRHTPACLA